MERIDINFICLTVLIGLNLLTTIITVYRVKRKKEINKRKEYYDYVRSSVDSLNKSYNIKNSTKLVPFKYNSTH